MKIIEKIKIEIAKIWQDKSRRKVFLCLSLMILAGTFLRAYRFHDWLYFYPDQARDLTIANDYLNGDASLPLLGFKAASSNFQLGAMYSYFQIVSGFIFGASPETMAYPDLLFGILTIPLLYVYLKKFFSENVSLLMAALYSVSFYAIRYSRFAWNVNPIPFFCMLFLLSFYELLVTKNKTPWKWIVALGVSLGVSVQLHTVLLVFLPLMTILLFGYLLYQDKQIAKKLLAVFFIALVLNTGQIVSELHTNFKNTKYFFKELGLRSPDDKSGVVTNFSSNVLCESQASTSFLSSQLGDDNCVQLLRLQYDPLAGNSGSGYWKLVGALSFGFLVLLWGYLILLWQAWKEKDYKRKAYLVLNLMYASGIFLVILPIITHNGQVRYWLPVIFVPFLSLALIFENLAKRYSQKFSMLLLTVLVFALAVSNFSTIFSEAKLHQAKTRSNAQYVVLGELEDMERYMESQTAKGKIAYVFGGPKFMQNFFRPLDWVAISRGLDVERGPKNPQDAQMGSSMFFLGQSSEVTSLKYGAIPEEFNLKTQTLKNFGNLAVYKVNYQQ